MYQATMELISDSAKAKAKLCSTRFFAYLTHSAMAGVYLGFGVVLVFALSTSFHIAQSPAASLIMGTTFGIALSLVVMAGAELFTGNTMTMVIGILCGKSNKMDLLKVWCGSYLGNFIGSLLFAYIASKAMIIHDPSWLHTIAQKKMHASWMVLFLRGILCNWLVVLAIWCSYRLQTETGKLIMIWWCILGFVGSGYEHSIANMSLLTLANFLPEAYKYGISWGGVMHNLIPVTLGNIVSGVFFMALPYFYVSPYKMHLKKG